jgi:PAS domain S-box-containing protein
VSEPGFLALALVVAACSALVVAGIRRWRPQDPIPWRLLALALAMFAAAGAVAVVAVVPTPGGGICSTLSRSLFALAYLPFAGALIRFQFRSARAATAIDAAIIAIAVSMAWWVFVAGWASGQARGSCQDQVLVNLTPVADVTLAVLAARLLMARGGGQRAARLLAGSAILLSALDLAAASAQPAWSILVLGGYGLAAIMAAAAALNPSMAMPPEPRVTPPSLVSVPRIGLLAAAGVLGPLLLIAEHGGMVHPRGIVIEIGTMLIFLLAILRLWLLNVREASAVLAAEASRDRLRLALDAVQMATWEWRRETNATTRTPGMSALYGMDPALDASPVRAFFGSRIHPDDRAAYTAWESAMRHQAGPHEIEHRVLLPSGEVRWLRDRGNVILGADGQPALIRGVTQDITALTRATAGLRAAEQRLQRLIAQLPAMVYTVENGVLASVTTDPVTRQAEGLDSADWIGNWDSRLHPDDRAAVLAEARRTDETLEPFRMEYRERDASGRWRWVRDEARWVEPSHGAPGYWLGMRFNVTAEATARLALADAEERYRTLVEGLPAVVYLNDPGDSLRPVFISPQLEQMTGYRPEEWLAESPAWLDCIHPDDRARVAAEERERVARGEAMTLEYRLVRRDGRVIWIHDWMSPVSGADGARQYWQGFMLDVTAQVEAERELRAAWAAAEESSRLKSAFLSTISHELRTPMNGIIGYAGLLLSGLSGSLSSQQEDDVRQIAASGDRLLGLIDELLDQSRIESGRVAMSPEAVPLPEALEGVRAQLAPLAAEAHLWFRVETAPGTPDAWVDPGRLHQMLVNLAGNSIKFTRAGGVTLSARPGADGGVAIDVRDTGIGIAPENLPMLFEPFWQVERSPSRRYGGAGLGLSITRRLAEAHGGRIEVESDPGSGSVFRLWLPAAPPG